MPCSCIVCYILDRSDVQFFVFVCGVQYVVVIDDCVLVNIYRFHVPRLCVCTLFFYLIFVMCFGHLFFCHLAEFYSSHLFPLFQVHLCKFPPPHHLTTSEAMAIV